MRFDRTTRFGLGAVLVLFIGFVVILWQSDALVFTGNAPSAQIVTAYLSLVAAFFASIVSLVGLLLKHALDTRAELRLLAENKRNEILQREAEDRLKLEAAIRAVQLLAKTDGGPSIRVQCAGAVTTLSSLGQHALALALVTELLHSDSLHPATAAYIIDRALRCEELAIQQAAVITLRDLAPKLITQHSAEFPAVLVEAPHRQPIYVRRWLPVVIGNMFVARPLVEWSTRLAPSASGLAAVLAITWQNEVDADAKNDCGSVLAVVAKIFPRIGDVTGVFGTIDVPAIAAQAASSRPLSDPVIDIVSRLREWAERAE